MVLFLIIQGYIYLPTYLLTYLLTYSMVQSPSSEANWFAASQEIPIISRNPKVHYRTHKRPSPVSILGQPNPVHIPTSHLLEIHLISPPFVFCAMPPLETLPPPNPGDPSEGVVCLRIVLSPEEASCMWVFLNRAVLQGGVVKPSPNPHAGGSSLVGCPQLLIQFIRSYHPYRRPFLYPHPEDAPYRGDRDPLHGQGYTFKYHYVVHPHTQYRDTMVQQGFWCSDLLINTPSHELYRIILLIRMKKNLMMANFGRNM